MSKSKVIEQTTQRHATRQVSATFVKVGDTDNHDGEWRKPSEKGTDADLMLLRRLASTYGIEMRHYSWSNDTIELEDTVRKNETFYVEITDGSGSTEEFEVVESRQKWFLENIAPILEASGCAVMRRKVVEEKQKAPYIQSRYRETNIDGENPDWDLPEGVSVEISELDLTGGKVVIEATSVGGTATKNGANLTEDSVEMAIRYLHDCSIDTLREFDCWDEDLYTRECQTNLSAESIRVCDTAFLSD